MEDLIDWLRAVLDEDEAAARAATPGPWAPSGHSVITADDIEISDVPRRDAPHIARHDPRQVLADIAAKRAILDLHDQSGVRWVGFPRADRQESYCVHDQQAAPCHTVRLLASAYRHRPGWRAEWER